MMRKQKSRRMSMTGVMAVTAILGVGAFALPAQAIPLLQLYIEGSVYDPDTESWVLETPEGEDAPDSIRLWAIGAVGKWDGHPIEDVRLAIAYDSKWGELDFIFDPANTGGQNGFWPGDPGDEPLTEPDNPQRLQYVSDDPGTTPTLSDGRNLPSHGVYNQDGIAWQEFALEDFTRTDWHLTDFIDADFEDLEPQESKAGEIKVYDISIFGNTYGVDRFHFDLYNSKPAGRSGRANAWFAPFSHNADGDVTVVPTPSAVGVGLVGAMMLLGMRSRRTRQA